MVRFGGVPVYDNCVSLCPPVHLVLTDCLHPGHERFVADTNTYIVHDHKSHTKLAYITRLRGFKGTVDGISIRIAGVHSLEPTALHALTCTRTCAPAVSQFLVMFMVVKWHISAVTAL